MAIDVGTPGFAQDITSASFKFNGAPLSAAITEMEWNCKTSEEVLHFQGLQDPQERSAGQREYDASITWGARQYALFLAKQGGWDRFAIANTPWLSKTNHRTIRISTRIRSLSFVCTRIAAHSTNRLVSSRSRAPFLSYDQEVTEDADTEAVI